MKHVVVLGGGFAGLYLAKGLRHAPVRVTLVDRRNHHLFQPMLYQVATAALSPGDIASPIRSILRKSTNTEVLLGEATFVDVEDKTVSLADGTRLSYDYLAIAVGARHSYFGHDEWEKFAPGLKSLEDALDIRRRVLVAFERAEREPDPVRRQQLLTFVVVGGGPTGVEVAGALAELRRFALRRDFRRIDPGEATVMLLEGGPRLLPSYPARLSDAAKGVLRRLGVEVRLETRVTEIDAEAVHAGGWTIPSETVIWAAGNQVGSLLRSLNVALDRQGRVIVEPDCTVANHPELFVLGDAAAFHHQKEFEVLPGVCPVAVQQGQHAARTILTDLEGHRRQPFRYRDKGQLAVIGRGRALADFGRLQLAGFFAWLTWVFVHIFFLIGFRNRVLVLFEWAWSYFTFQRGARLITGEISPVAPRDRE